MLGRSASLTALLVVIFLALVPAALGHDHSAPRVDLAVAGKIQRGQLHHATWDSGDGQTCVSFHTDGTGEYPAGLAVERGRHRVRVRFFKEQRPTDVAIGLRYSDIGGRTPPSGEARRPRYSLTRATRDGQTIWRATFRVRLRQIAYRHAYIHVEARWRDEQGCGGRQEINRHFHLKVASPV